jgi:putative FmdB family regulatory protein
MPIYDYKCRRCGQAFELLVLKGTVAECPQCQSQELEQQISGFAVSSDSIRQSNVQRERNRVRNSSIYKDRKVHEAEEIKEHAAEYNQSRK